MSDFNLHEYKGYQVEIRAITVAVPAGVTGCYRISNANGSQLAEATTPIMLDKDMADRVALSIALACIDKHLRVADEQP